MFDIAYVIGGKEESTQSKSSWVCVYWSRVGLLCGLHHFGFKAFFLFPVFGILPPSRCLFLYTAWISFGEYEKDLGVWGRRFIGLF